MTSVKRCWRVILTAIAFVAVTMVVPGMALAGIIITGRVTPSDSGSWNSSNNGIVGHTDVGDVTVDSGSALASNDGYIGGNSLTSGGTGTVTVKDSSIWMNNSNLYVGFSSTGVGALYVQNGGTVSANWGIAVAQNSGSQGEAQVDGNGSVLAAQNEWGWGGLSVGKAGDGVLTVSNGGDVDSGSGTIGSSCYGTGSGTGTVTVSGNGSTWNLHSEWCTLSLGQADGSSGTLVINNGGAVHCDNEINIGENQCATGVIALDGSDSTLTAVGDLYVGKSGSGTLNIHNQSEVMIGGATYVAYGASSTGTLSFGASNGGTLTTQSLCASPSNLYGVGTINASGLMSDMDMTFDSATGLTQTLPLNSGSITVNLDMSDSSNVGHLGVDGNHSLTIDGIAVHSRKGQVGYQSGSANATVTGSNAAWINSEQFYVGCEGAAGSVSVLNGAQLSNTSGYVGYNAGSSGTVTVDGGGSTWNNSEISVGVSGGTGTLEITNGAAAVSDAHSCWIGTGGVGVVTVDGDGSMLTVNNSTGGLYVGSNGTGVLNITDHGAVDVVNSTHAGYSGGTGTINFGADGGTLTTRSLYAATNQVTGAGTIDANGLVSDVDLLFDSSHGPAQTLTWGGVAVNLDVTGNVNPVGDLGVGYQSGGGGSATILSGTVNSANSYIAYASGSTGTALVSGAGSTWNTSDNFYLGHKGDSALTVQNGGRMNVGGYFRASGYVDNLTTTMNILSGGTLSGSSDINLNCSSSGTCSVTVSGNNSVLSTDRDVKICCANGSLTDLEISNGGAVHDVNGYIGYSSSWGAATTMGTATVDGAGSTWSNSGTLHVGYNSLGVLNIFNGGSVESATGQIGSQSNSMGVATVEGTGSTWTNTGDLYVGNSSDGNLIISSGGSVTVAGATYVGNKKYYIGTVDFNNGTLTTTSLYASPSHSYSTLTGNGTVNAYGLVSDLNLTFNSTSSLIQTFTTGGVVINLDLSDSSNVGDLGAGYWGTGKSLMIQNGATVYSASGCLGYHVGSSGKATVTGSSSTWVCSGSITVGYKGSGTLNITNDGTVVTNTIVGLGNYQWGTDTATVHFDGGVLKACNASNSDWIADGSRGSGTYTVTVKEGGATFDTAGYDMGITVPLQHGSGSPDGGITKVGVGRLTLSGANTYDGVTTVVVGVLELDGSAQDPVLNVGGADIQGGKLIFTHSGGTTTGGQVWGFLDDSFNSNFTAGQIFSSTAQGEDRALGWADDGGEVTVMYTLYGDSNLDGSVNGTDLNAVLSYYNQSTDLAWGQQIWAHGDFNYDGSVNGTDLNTVLSNYNQSLSSSTAAVPEPSTLLLMVLGLLGLLAWQKRFGIY